MAPAPERSPPLQRIVTLFETLVAADLPRLGEFYAPDARFKDPFNEVRGLPAIERVFAHMFAALHEPGFAVRQTIEQDDRAFVLWDFRFGVKPGAARHAIEGGSRLRFAADGRIAEHVDHWDASELFERLPVAGGLTRWLKRRMRA